MKNIIMTFGTLLIIYSMPSWSACKSDSTGVTINTSSLTLQRDIPVGSRLAVQEFTSTTTSLFTCPSSNSETLYLAIKALTTKPIYKSGNGYIFDTNIPGLGIQLGGVDTLGSIRGWIGTASNNIDSNPMQSAIQSFTGTNIGTVKAGAAVTFYKVGEMSSGVLTQKVATLIMGNISGWAYPEVPVNISGLNITVLACSLTTPTVAAPLGNVYATAFGGVGTTTGNVDFNLGLNCAAGTKINLTMNGTQNTDTANTSVLALTGAGSAGVAKGVGAQILYNNAPLNIGSNLLLKTSAGGIETFPFKARYYQTLSNVLPGSANATATLNITYQ